MPLYFAYGSNLSPESMKEKYPSTRVLGAGYLLGYRLDFTRHSSGWNGGVADVVPDSKSDVWGLVYEISDEDLTELDKQEGYPKAYIRFRASIRTSVSSIPDVFVYQVVKRGGFVAPIKAYVEIIIKAAEKFEFPKTYRDFLNTIEVKN